MNQSSLDMALTRIMSNLQDFMADQYQSTFNNGLIRRLRPLQDLR